MFINSRGSVFVVVFYLSIYHSVTFQKRRLHAASASVHARRRVRRVARDASLAPRRSPRVRGVSRARGRSDVRVRALLPACATRTGAVRVRTQAREVREKMRVVHPNWFADVPDACAWASEANTVLRVVAPDARDVPPPTPPCLEMRGRVVARDGGPLRVAPSSRAVGSSSRAMSRVATTTSRCAFGGSNSAFGEGWHR